MSVPLTWLVRGRELTLDRPIVMGIVNVTPDSFSDGGRYLSVDAAVRHCRALVDDGADILDLGAESTRPQGAQPVTAAEEIERLLPVLAAVRAALPGVTLSVDTVKSDVARAALDAGAAIVNDVSALRLDPRMARTVSDYGAGVVLMHSRGGVADMGTYAHAEYHGDVMDVVQHELGTQLAVAKAAGIAPASIAVDPGIGFSKRPADSLRMLGTLERMTSWGHPVVVGASRKRFIGSITGVPEADARVHGSVGAAVAAYERGASVVRVHDVAATRQALDVVAAIRRAASMTPQPA
jgi:dihydropteroate synthase